MSENSVIKLGESAVGAQVTFIWLNETSAHLFKLADAMWQHLSPDEPHVPKANMRARMCLRGIHFWLFALETFALPAKSPLGMASLYYKEDSSLVEIHEVVVDPAVRGQHLGENIMKMLIAHVGRVAARRGVALELVLTSKTKHVAANELYLKLGFVCITCAGKASDSNHYRMLISPSIK